MQCTPAALVTFSVVINYTLTWTFTVGSIPDLPTTSLPTVPSKSGAAQSSPDPRWQQALCRISRWQVQVDHGKFNNVHETATIKFVNKIRNKGYCSSGEKRTTIRHVECSLLLAESSESDRCEQCTAYRKTLNKAISRKGQDINTGTPNSRTNHCYLRKLLE